ncbi:MAG: type II toxin-antitoxin system RelE/ParE family toxin [Ghiorsea sp.]
MKELYFAGNSLDELRAFPRDAKREAGFQLDRVQNDLDPNDWKTMKSIGAGVREIRLRCSDGTYRVIYTVKIVNAVYVLHAFQKKTQKTPHHAIEMAKKRLSELGG